MSTTIDQIFILAAGKGKRMCPITDSIPKPLIKIADKTIIDNILEKVEALSHIKKIIINSYYLADILENHIKSLNNPKIIISQETTKLETGGGLLAALHLFDKTKPILLINGDIIWQNEKQKIPNLQLMMDNFDEKKMDILLGLKPKDQFFGYDKDGDFDFDHKNNNIIKSDNNASPNYAFVGIQIIHPKILKNCPAPPFSINYFYKKARQNNGILKRVKGVELNGKFFHIGTADIVERLNNTKSLKFTKIT